MASDDQDLSRQKHRRASDDEAEDSSKRRKHRHHHHRHHRHHHRRNRGETEAKLKHGEEVGIKHEGEEAVAPPPPPVAAPSTVSVMSSASWRPDYDMEEGEILEDEVFDAGGADVEASGIEAVEVQLDNDNTGLYRAEVRSDRDSCLPVEDGSDRNPIIDVNGMDRKKGDETKTYDTIDYERNFSVEHYTNGYIGREDNTKEKSKHPGYRSPEGSGKRKGHYDDESELQNGGKRHKASPSHDRHHEKVRSRSRSSSPDRSRERSRSESSFQEASLLQTHQHDAAYSKDRRHKRESGDERMVRHNNGSRHGSRDLPRDQEKAHSSSYSRHARGDRRRSREIGERDSEGSRGTWDRDSGGKELDRGSRREKEADREGQRERDAKERDWEREREREKDRERDRERRQRDRERDGNRNRESDTGSRPRGRYDFDISYGGRERHSDYRHRKHDDTDFRARMRKDDPQKLANDHPERDKEKSRRDEAEEEDYQERIALQLPEQEEEEVNRIKEESRRRRQAILEKYKAQQLKQQQEPQSESTAGKENAEQPSQSVPVANVQEDLHGRSGSADIYHVTTPFSVGKSPPPDGISAFKKAGGLGEGTPKSERSDDMFSEDIFGESPAGVRKAEKGDGLAVERSGLHDNWDDADGYYSYRLGELLDGRYEIIAAHGKGVFSTVVRAKDLKAGSGDPEEVAIKIIRNNDTMYKAGLEELVILKKLVGADQEDKRHCVRFLSSFKYRNHLCLVFESLHMNLREVLKKFGRNIGLKLTAVRTYAKQLFIALKHLRNCGVLHSDIKPDNMLVNDTKNVLKLCDFGNAMFAGKNEVTPYLVSRFYRAPEIILGLHYDHPMDIWSVGCCLFELYSGKVLFPGSTNNEMLRLHMELKGPFPKKMLRKGAFTDQHFDQDLNFLATEEDPVTKKTMKRLLLNMKPKDIGTIVLGSPGEDPKMLANFKDLLEKIFVLDPDKRITVVQALGHPFITGK
ncbi:hypothetical protein RJ639_013126 [Escallonia herrerae]|uniref:Serine/threonine-protein kinase PRP4 homolog n=1 Tax=Escallonia herrerae TaxID=1293975 RepID=A0AA88VIL0_9ASTE|nr:hypothetical protein RJ639_013126 [Escallonia herrerae]